MISRLAGVRDCITDSVAPDGHPAVFYGGRIAAGTGHANGRARKVGGPVAVGYVGNKFLAVQFVSILATETYAAVQNGQIRIANRS